jgi:hypothetical protein
MVRMVRLHAFGRFLLRLFCGMDDWGIRPTGGQAEASDERGLPSVKIVKAILTCSDCPSQWDAWDSEGNYWYLRYRFGHGKAVQFDNPDPETWTVHELNRPQFSFNTGDKWDGSIDLLTFCRLAGIELELEGMHSAQADSSD